MEMNYASRSVANAGLTTGIIGTALGVLNGGAGLLNLGTPVMGCHENMPVNRYEMTMSQALAAEQAKVQKLESEKYTDKNILETYKYIDGRLRTIESEICDQKVYNATNTATISCMGGQIASLQGVLNGLTKVVIPIGNVCPLPATATTTPTT